MKKQLTALLLALGSYSFALADTFVVTSNADSGSGTLREAISKANANGTATTDYIHFNISELAFNKRVIRLATELPALSSNLVVDGTTQPGERYAITDAKIAIVSDEPASTFSMIKIENAEKVKIYGLYLYYGYWKGFFGAPFRSEYLYGINLVKSNGIEIGALGKGNVINGVVHGIYSNSDSCRNVTIRSNYIGHGAYYTNTNDEFDQVILNTECGITFANVKDITIGGDQPTDGNVFGSNMRAVSIDSRYTTQNGFIRMRYNIFGRKYDKKTPISVYDFWDTYINIGRSRNNPVNWTSAHNMDYRVEVLDNDIPNHIGLGYISDSMIIKRNRFEGGATFGQNGYGAKLAIWRSPGGGIVGDDDLANGNQFLYKKDGTYFHSISIGESGPITVLKNVFDCNSVYGSTTRIGHFIPMPFAQVDLTTSNSVSGRAMPNTRVDLYYDDACTACEGKEYITYVMADANGRWEYKAPLKGTVVATSTNAAGYTSMFSQPEFNWDKVKITQPTCGKKNGSITGFTAEGAETYFWINLQTDDTVSHSIDLLNAGPGEYLLFGVHGGTCIRPYFNSMTLEDRSPWVRKEWSFVQEPSCGRFNGSINGVVVWNNQNASIKWINNQGQTIGKDLHIGNLGPGTYRIVATDTTPTGGCSDTATFVLTNQSGPTLHTDQAVIANAVCNANGSITGISATNITGTPFIEWINEINVPVSNKLDLLNVPAGSYRLKFKDQSSCDTITTSVFIVPNTGAIVIDAANMMVSPSKCTGASGAISNIKVTGASTYQWINTATMATVGNTLDISLLEPGQYQLIIKNTTGCTQSSPVITVPQAAFAGIGVTSAAMRAASCAMNNGQIVINAFNKDASTFTFRWVDSTSGLTISTGTSLLNRDAGTYQLFAKDANGCEAKIYTARMNRIPLPVINEADWVLTKDECGLGSGTIANVRVTGSIGPTTYQWKDATGAVVSNSLELQQAKAGTYTLTLTDFGVCVVTTKPVVIGNTNKTLAPPQYDEQIIPRYSSATLQLKNPEAVTYRLFADVAGVQTLQQNNTGQFPVVNIDKDTTFYIQKVQGTCTSVVSSAHIKVVDRSYFTIPNAFTPNGDGKNDVLTVKAIGYVALTGFRIYNRYGQLVFHTDKLGAGWDGRVNGVLQPTGTFVWIAEGKDIKGHLIQDKGSFVIIR